MLFESTLIAQDCGRKKSGFFTENWMIVANCQFREPFVCGAASAAPSVGEHIKDDASEEAMAADKSPYSIEAVNKPPQRISWATM